MRIAIAGAGVLGAAAALHLTRAGHDVTLLEQEQVAGATTGLAAGLLSLGVQDPLERRLVRATLEGLEATARELDTPSPLNRPGSFVIARRTHEAAHLHALAKDLDRLDEPHETLTPREWGQEMENRGLPARSDDIDRVLSIPGDAWALSGDTTQLMVRSARRTGLKLRQHEKVDSLLWRERHKATGFRLAGGETVDADAVILATGAWTRPLLEREGLRLPAQAFTTHAAILALDEPFDAPIVHDHPGHYYFRPESDTHLLVGNGTNTDPIDPARFHPTPDPDFFRRIAERITQRFPGLGKARLQNAWRGVLSATPDRGALVGAHPEAEGLWLITGDNGYGFMRSWALGRILAAKIDPEVDLGPVPEAALAHTEPARFWPDPPQHFPIREGFELVEEKPAADPR